MMYPGPGGNRGEFIAWDGVHGKKAWGIKERFPVWTGALVTAGDVVFYGTHGWLGQGGGRAERRACSGSSRPAPDTSATSSATPAPTASSTSPSTPGVGGWAGAAAFGLSPDDPTGALGFANAMKDLTDYTGPGGMLYVFAFALRRAAAVC